MRPARLVLAIGLVAAALGRAAAAPPDPITIGVAAPLSGPDAVFGDQMVSGVKQAVADIDAAGGVLGRPLVAVPRDDHSDSKQGVAVANAFVAAKVPIVVGDFSSAVTAPASAVYADAGVLDITPSASAPLVTERGLATVFRTCSREDAQAAVAARYLMQRHLARIAIVYDRTTAGKALADAVRAALAAAGRQDVYYGSLDSGARDATRLVARLKASGAQVVFWGGGGAGAGLLAHDLRDANAKMILMGGIAMGSDDFASAAGPAADGTLMVFPQDPRTRPAAADLLRRLQGPSPLQGSSPIQGPSLGQGQRQGAGPGAYVFYAYAAVQVVRQAAESAHSLDPETLAATMHSGMTFKTVLGDFAFDAKGDPVPSDLAVYVWHKGATGKMTFDDLAKS